METLTVHTIVLQQVLLSVRVLYQYYSCYQYAVYYYFTPTRYVFSSVATTITLVVQFSGQMHKLFISKQVTQKIWALVRCFVFSVTLAQKFLVPLSVSTLSVSSGRKLVSGPCLNTHSCIKGAGVSNVIEAKP